MREHKRLTLVAMAIALPAAFATHQSNTSPASDSVRNSTVRIDAAADSEAQRLSLAELAFLERLDRRGAAAYVLGDDLPDGTQ